MRDSRPSSAAPLAARRSPLVFGLSLILLISLTAALAGLGSWQVARLYWKEKLIARIESRVNAEPQPVPGRAEWPKINADDYEYRRVRVAGTLLHDKETQVYASTDLGPGYWVLTPISVADGTTVLVNRGFVPTDHRNPATRSAGNLPGEATVTGLLRLTEPEGTMIRSNIPSEDRWYSRDVAAIAEKRGLSNVAPYFIDADSTANPGGLPVGGQTQLVFANHHLGYAITWYALALMSLLATGYLIRTEWQARRGPGR
jgi:surfeit locus 1 family protein